MKNLTCRNCGGVMVFDPSANKAYCKYCGSYYVLNHEDTDYYRDFYLQRQRYLVGGKDETERRLRSDKYWEELSDRISFECVDGKVIELKYMYNCSDKVADMYVCRSNIAYYVHPGYEAMVNKFRSNCSMLDYPSADVRNLNQFFPNVTGGFALKDGGTLLVLKKSEDEYPLRVFGKLDSRLTAWIISRLENLCCVLEFSNLVHPAINADSVFINPYLHTAALYGEWWYCTERGRMSYDNSHMATSEENLIGIRTIAARLLGFETLESVSEIEGIPEALINFIKSKPKYDAYEDFGYWDEMLIKAFGERRFIKMDVSDETLYGNNIENSDIVDEND